MDEEKLLLSGQEYRDLRHTADHDLLVRIDERTKNWEQTLKTFVTKKEHESLEIIVRNSVTTKEFLPIKNLVYGFVAIVLLAVIGGIVSLVVLKP